MLKVFNILSSILIPFSFLHASQPSQNSITLVRIFDKYCLGNVKDFNKLNEIAKNLPWQSLDTYGDNLKRYIMRFGEDLYVIEYGQSICQIHSCDYNVNEIDILLRENYGIKLKMVAPYKMEILSTYEFISPSLNSLGSIMSSRDKYVEKSQLCKTGQGIKGSLMYIKNDPQ